MQAVPVIYDVFISYRWTSPDQEWVREQLYPSLMNAGLKVFLDVYDFVPGRSSIMEMERAIRESKHVICIITPEYFEAGKMVGFESLSAMLTDPDGRNSSVIPLILRQTDIPVRLRGLIPVSWIKPNDHSREWRKLLNLLGSNNNVSRPGIIQEKEDTNLPDSQQVADDVDTEDMEEEDWEFLLDRLNDQTCTPIIGPGIYSEEMPFSSLTQDWSSSPDYPFSQINDLAMAAQFRSLRWGSIEPKNKIIQRMQKWNLPDFNDPNEPHSLIAQLPINNYITTNYDDFMFKALQFHNKPPRRDLCRWDDPQNAEQLSIFKTGYVPDSQNPVVFHLFGYSIKPRAIVLTEDDHLDFLSNVSQYPALIPPAIQEALTNSSVLLLGYQLNDWSFRILFRTLVNYLKNSPYQVHLSVQLAPLGKEASPAQIRKAKNYFKRYLGMHKVQVSWKTCPEFIRELNIRWKNSGYGR